MSTVKVNTLTGTTTAGSIAVTGEGNSTTTNLQQGLCKSWVSMAADGASLVDSFNIGGSVDSGTGDRRVSFTSNMNNAAYTLTTGVTDNTASTSFLMTDITAGTIATTGFDFEVYFGSGSTDRTAFDEESFVTVHGDLA
jgi:hypothetical protein